MVDPITVTNEQLAGKVVDSVKAVQDAELTVVAEGKKLAAHMKDPNAHGLDVSACIAQSIADHEGNIDAHKELKTALEWKLAGKADASALAQKVDKDTLAAELTNKADMSALDLKADATVMSTELAAKADVSALSLKADAAVMTEALAVKADVTALAQKANKADLELKADKTEVDALSDRVDTIAETGGGVVVILAPTIISPDIFPMGVDMRLAFIATPGVMGSKINAFRVSVTGFDDRTMQATDGTATGVWPISADTSVGAVVYISAVAIDSLGNASPAAQSSVMVVDEFIAAPVLAAPTAGFTAFGYVILTTSPFTTPPGGDSHVSTDWWLTSDPLGATVVVEAWNSPDLLSHTFTEDVFDFPDGTLLYAWAKHNGERIGAGMHSEPVAFTMKQGPDVDAFVYYNTDNIAKSVYFGNESRGGTSSNADGELFFIGNANDYPDTSNASVIIKCDAQYNVLWSRKIQHAAIVGGTAFDITATDDGGALVLAEIAGCVVIRMDADGNIIWSFRLDNTPTSTRGITPVRIRTDSSGNVYVLGHTYAYQTSHTIQLVVFKFDSSQKFIWGRRFVNPSGGSLYIYDAFLNSVDQLVFSYADGLTILSSSGTTVRNFAFDTTDLNPHTHWVLGIDKSASEDIYCSGRLTSGASNTALALLAAKLTVTGKIIWAKYVKIDGRHLSACRSAIDSFDNLYIVGNIAKNTSTSLGALFLAKFDAAGELLSFQVFDSLKTEVAVDVEVDSDGTVRLICTSDGFGGDSNKGVVVRYKDDLALGTYALGPMAVSKIEPIVEDTTFPVIVNTKAVTSISVTKTAAAFVNSPIDIGVNKYGALA